MRHSYCHTHDVRIGDCLFKTVQIGGMATSPQERGKGFGGQLLSHVVDRYLPKIDFLFLFAHRGVVEFYPRYGFKRVRQENFSIDVARYGKRVFEKLDLQKQDARKRFDDLLAKRTEVSNAVCVLNSEWLRHFYYRFVFPHHLWIDSLNEVIIAATREQNTLVVHDVISASVDPLLFEDISWPEIDKITIGFTPDLYTGNFSVSQISDDDQLFVQGRFPNITSPFKFPAFFQT